MLIQSRSTLPCNPIETVVSISLLLNILQFQHACLPMNAQTGPSLWIGRNGVSHLYIFFEIHNLKCIENTSRHNKTLKVYTATGVLHRCLVSCDICLCRAQKMVHTLRRFSFDPVMISSQSRFPMGCTH